MTDTSMTIAWLPPLDNGGLDILDYTVEKREASKKAWQKVRVLHTLGETSVAFNSPSPPAQRKIKITFLNN